MNYTDLKQAIADTVENSFTEAQLARFVTQSEQKIYRAIDFPALRQNKTGLATVDNPYLSIPSGLLNVRSIAVTDGGYEYLLQKDVSFVREAYPFPAVTGQPKCYAFFDEDSFILGPTPDSSYNVEIHYDAYPESIVTAGTTWLGDAFDNALLNASLIEAIRFIKGEEADIKLYQTMYAEALTLLGGLSDKIKQDAYRPVGGMRG